MLILPGTPIFAEPKEKFLRLIGRDFKFDLTERISLVADVNHFRYKEDESVYKQAKDQTPNYIEVYWDGVWICDFTDRERPEVVRLRFLQGFTKAYEENKIFLTKPEEREEVTVEKTIDDEIKKLKQEKTRTQEEALSKEVIIEVLEEKKKGNQKKGSKLSEFI